MTSKTAILLFSRTASSEARAKQLAGSADRNARLLDRMIRRTHRLAARTGLPVFQIDEEQQSGTSFGERINQAAAQIVAKGYSKLIILGNDAPQLRLNDLQRAKKGLEAGKFVIGPDRRGGAYLIGVGADQLGSAFEELPWQTDRLCTDLAGLLAKTSVSRTLLAYPDLQANHENQNDCNNLLFVRELSDVNSIGDLSRLIGLLAGKSSVSLLLARVSIDVVQYLVTISHCCYLSATGRRGPPVLG
ncbi:hypothetical protein CEQ90_09800 [Lewinellaceae bacterium SD302]|nr:hypothetical protein CEQ90_09800 [Lewinellaceae bacterium SD302]